MENKLNLGNFAVGEQAVVTGVDVANKQLRRRILDMGVTAGTVVTITRVAPLGDPVQVSLRGYELILRKSELALINVKRLEQKSEHNLEI